MKEFKRNLVVLLSVLMVLSSFSGCSKETVGNASSTNEEDAAVSEENTGEADKTATIEFWLDKMSDQTIGDKLAEAWKEDAGVEVKIVNYPDVAAYQTSLQQSIDDPSAPGLFTWWSGPQLETLAKNDKLVDLTQEWDSYIENGVAADIKEAFTIDGKAYAAPYSILYNTVIFNKEVFEEAGIRETPKTFDEFLDVCEKIKQIGVTPIGLKNDSWASFIWFQQFVAAYDAQLYMDICDGTKKYTDDDVKKVMEIWRDMFDKGYFAKPVLYSDMYKDFATGKTAMILEASPTSNVLEDEYGMAPGETLGAFVVPSMNNEKSVIFFEASPICIPVASEGKEAALEALRGFYKKDTQTVMVNELGIANTSEVVVDNVTIQEILDMSADAENYQLILRYYENTPEEIRNYALDELSRFMYSGADVEEVLNNIQRKADSFWSAQ